MKETVTDMWNSERVGASRGPEMRGSEPSALPHLTPLNLNPQPPSSTSFIQPVAGTQECSAHQNNGHHASRAGAISSYVWASHGVPKPAPTDPSHPAPRSSTHIDKNTARATATAGYGSSSHRTDLASHYVGEPGQIPLTSNHAQASYHQWPTRSHVAEATVRTKSNPTTTDHEGYGLRPVLLHPTPVSLVRPSRLLYVRTFPTRLFDRPPYMSVSPQWLTSPTTFIPLVLPYPTPKSPL